MRLERGILCLRLCVCLSVGLSVCLLEPPYFLWRYLKLGFLRLLEAYYKVRLNYLLELSACLFVGENLVLEYVLGYVLLYFGKGLFYRIHVDYRVGEVIKIIMFGCSLVV